MISGCLSLSGSLICLLVYGKKRFNYVRPSAQFQMSITLIFVLVLATLIICGSLGFWLEFIITLLISIGTCVLWSIHVRKKWPCYGDDYDNEYGLKMTDDGEILKKPDDEIIFTAVSELINKEDIAELHYTTLFVDGHLVTEGAKHYIVERSETGETARLEILFEGDVPIIADEEKHRYKGTLMVENGRTLLQWTQICQ